MKELLLDSNVALRFLLSDDPKQSPLSTGVFAAAARGDCLLRLEHLVIAECVYVLIGEFGRDRRSVAVALRQLIECDGVYADQQDLLIDALRRFSESRVDFQDAWLAATSAKSKIDVVSFDRDFDKFADIVRIEPGRDSL